MFKICKSVGLLAAAFISLVPFRGSAQTSPVLQDVPAQLETTARTTPPPPPSTAAVRPLGYLAPNVINFGGVWAPLPATAQRVRMPNNTDNDYSRALTIGFPFQWRGRTYNNVVMNTNGFVVLGSNPGSVPDLFFSGPQSNTGGALFSGAVADTNIISVFNVDLENSDSGTAEFRQQTTGTAPNRVFTLEWRNVKDKAGLQLSRATFQLKLYETTNFIDFVYGPFIASNDAPVFRSSAVGLKGAPGQILFGSKFSGAPWTATTWLSDPNNVNQHNYRNAFLPDEGRTYRFTTTLQRNVGVAAVLRLPGPACNQGIIDSVGVVVVNSGSQRQTGIPITMRINGTTIGSATVPGLDSGRRDTVFFRNIDFSRTGNYGITAFTALPNDQLNGNDTLRPDSVRNLRPRLPDGRVNSFEGENDVQGYIFRNLNANGFNWLIGNDPTRARTGDRFLYLSNSTSAGSDNILYSGCYGLLGRNRYKVKFGFANINTSGAIDFELLAMRSQSADTTGAIHIARIENYTRTLATGGWSDTTVRFFALDTGAYYLAWYCYSPPNNSFFALDDIAVDTAAGLLPVGLPTAQSATLRVVPNPANGQGFAIAGLTQPSVPAMLVDALGRRRNLMLRRSDGYRVEGPLAPGLYLMQVQGRSLRLAVE